MVFQHHPPQLGQQLITLLGVQLIDLLGKRAYGKHRLPARDRVGPDHGMHGLQRLAYVVRTSSGLVVQRGPTLVRSLDKPISDERGAQALEKLLPGATEPVVHFVPAGPQRIATRLGQLRQPQTCIVRGTGLELDIAVPLRGVVAAPVLDLAGVDVEQLLARQRRDGADFVVVPEFRRAIQDRVDVQRRGRGLVGEFAQALDELLLQRVCQVVLFAEEDDTALAD